MLKCTRIVLLNNNPAKLYGLTKACVAIASRMPLEAPINADNRRYMTEGSACRTPVRSSDGLCGRSVLAMARRPI
jgi:hypothetical protein